MEVIVDIWDKYKPTVKNDDGDYPTPCYPKDIYGEITSSELKNLYSSYESPINCPYGVILNNYFKHYFPNENIYLKVPYDVNQYQLNLLTTMNDHVHPVYEYIVDILSLMIDWKNKNLHMKITVVYINRYSTYKVKYLIDNNTVTVDEIRIVKMGTDYLMKKFYRMFDDLNILVAPCLIGNALDKYKKSIKDYLDYFNEEIYISTDCIFKNIFNSKQFYSYNYKNVYSLFRNGYNNSEYNYSGITIVNKYIRKEYYKEVTKELIIPEYIYKYDTIISECYEGKCDLSKFLHNFNYIQNDDKSSIIYTNYGKYKFPRMNENIILNCIDFNNKAYIIPAYENLDKYSNNVCVYEYIIDALSYYFDDELNIVNSGSKVLVYDKYTITATRKGNDIIFTDYQLSNNVVDNKKDVYKFNKALNDRMFAFPISITANFLIGFGNVVKSKYNFILNTEIIQS